MIFRFAELFCGPGGLGSGALMAKIFHNNKEYAIFPVWANDNDPFACATYELNISSKTGHKPVCSDVRGLDIKSSIPDIDALAFGFPCNDFSVVGEKKGIEGSYGPLYKFGVKALEAKAPKWFIAENVGGLKSANNGKAFEQILIDLREAGEGYVLTPHLYKFEEYGVPQIRHRIVIVGIRKDLGLEFKCPAPTTKNKYISAKDAIENPPIPEDAPNNELTKQSHRVIERLKHIPPGRNAWHEDLPDHLKLNVSGARLSQIYKRLTPDSPAYTITGSGGGGTHVYHWKENRALTNRERARLQTFDDDFTFCGSKEKVRKQIGMAVPPKAAKVIFEAILKTFAGIEYPWVPSSFQEQ